MLFAQDLRIAWITKTIIWIIVQYYVCYTRFVFSSFIIFFTFQSGTRVTSPVRYLEFPGNSNYRTRVLARPGLQTHAGLVNARLPQYENDAVQGILKSVSKKGKSQ